jgi:hypothetical protein
MAEIRRAGTSHLSLTGKVLPSELAISTELNLAAPRPREAQRRQTSQGKRVKSSKNHTVGY